MAIKVLINGLFMPMNFPNNLFSFALMAMKLLVNKVEHLTAIIFFYISVSFLK